MNYKELCGALQAPEKTGRSRTLQLAKWENEHKIVKLGRNQYDLTLKHPETYYKYEEMRELIIQDTQTVPLPEILMFTDKGEPFYGREVINTDECKGNERQKQMVQWKRYYDIIPRPKSHEYLFNGRREYPIQDFDFGRHSVYRKYIEQLVMALCYTSAPDNQSEYVDVTLSKVKLYEALGFFTKKFVQILYHKVKARASEDYTSIYNYFRLEVFGKCNSVIESFRNSLKSRTLMVSEDVIQILPYAKKTDGSWDFEHYDNKWVTLSFDEGKKLTLEAKHIAMETINQQAQKEAELYGSEFTPLETEQDIMFRGYADAYYHETLEYVRYNYGWHMYRNAVHFSGKRDVLQRVLNDVVKQGNFTGIDSLEFSNMKKINQEFIEFLNRRTEEECEHIATAVHNIVNNRDGKGLLSHTYESIARDLMYGPMDFGQDLGEITEQDINQYVTDYKTIREGLIESYIKLKGHFYE